MKILKKSWFIFALATLLLVACSESEEAGQSESQEEVDVEEQSNKEFDPEDESDWPSSVRIGAASVGGSAYIYAGGFGGLIEQQTGVNSSLEETGGPVDAIQLIENGDIEIGMISLSSSWEGQNASADWTGGQTFDQNRVIFPMYQNIFHWWASESTGIKGIQDLSGKNVGVGPKGGTPGTYLPTILDFLDVDADPIYASVSDLTTQQIDGMLPAVGFASGLPFPSVVEAESQRELNIFGFSKNEIEKITDEFKYFTPTIVPAGTYKNQEDDVDTISVWMMAVASKDLSDSYVYQAVDSVMSNNEDFVGIIDVAKESIAENIKYNDIAPMHPGAIRWFEDNGYELHDAVYPPEYPKEN